MVQNQGWRYIFAYSTVLHFSKEIEELMQLMMPEVVIFNWTIDLTCPRATSLAIFLGMQSSATLERLGRVGEF